MKSWIPVFRHEKRLLVLPHGDACPRSVEVCIADYLQGHKTLLKALKTDVVMYNMQIVSGVTAVYRFV